MVVSIATRPSRFCKKVKTFHSSDSWQKSLNGLKTVEIKGIEADFIFIPKSKVATGKCTFSAFPIQKAKDSNLTWQWNRSRLSQGHYFIKSAVLDSQMLHTKFQGNHPSGSEKVEYLKFLAYMGKPAILVF